MKPYSPKPKGTTKTTHSAHVRSGVSRKRALKRDKVAARRVSLAQIRREADEVRPSEQAAERAYNALE